MLVLAVLCVIWLQCPTTVGLRCPKCVPRPAQPAQPVQSHDQLYYSAFVSSYNTHNLSNQLFMPLSSKGSRPLTQLLLKPADKCDLTDLYDDCTLCVKHQRAEDPSSLACVAATGANSSRLTRVPSDNLPSCEYTTELGETVASMCVCARDNCTAQPDTHFTHSQAPKVNCACNMPTEFDASTDKSRLSGCVGGRCWGQQCFVLRLHDQQYQGCTQQDEPSPLLLALDNTCVSPVSQYLSAKLVGIYSWGSPGSSVLCACSSSLCNAHIDTHLPGSSFALPSPTRPRQCRLAFDTVSHNRMRHDRATCYGQTCFRLRVNHFTHTQDKDTRTLGCVQAIRAVGAVLDVNLTYTSTQLTYNLHIGSPTTGAATPATAPPSQSGQQRRLTNYSSSSSSSTTHSLQPYPTKTVLLTDSDKSKLLTEKADDVRPSSEPTEKVAVTSEADVDSTTILVGKLTTTTDRSIPSKSVTVAPPPTKSHTQSSSLNKHHKTSVSDRTTANNYEIPSWRTRDDVHMDTVTDAADNLIEIRESRFGDQKQNVVQLTNEILAAKNEQDSSERAAMDAPTQYKKKTASVSSGGFDRPRAIERSVYAPDERDRLDAAVLAAAERHDELEALSKAYAEYDMRAVGFAGLAVLIFFCVFVCVISFVV